MLPWIIVDEADSPGGTRIVLARRGTEWEVRADRATLMSNRAHGSEEDLARLALERVPGATSVLIGGLGLGYSLRATLDLLPRHGQVVVAELSASVVEWNRSHVAELAGRPLDDPRAHVFVGDVRERIVDLATYDAILLDVDNGPDALVHDSNTGLYTADGIASCFTALRPGGVLAVWALGPDENYLRRLGKAGFEATTTWVPARAGGRKKHLLFLAVKAAAPSISGRAGTPPARSSGRRPPSRPTPAPSRSSRWGRGSRGPAGRDRGR
jgi:spermidine synthase